MVVDAREVVDTAMVATAVQTGCLAAPSRTGKIDEHRPHSHVHTTPTHPCSARLVWKFGSMGM